MSVYIKICGLTTSEQVAAAIEAGADGIGFVFAPSPRQVNVDRALELLEPVRDRVESVAVMRHPDANEARSTVLEFKPTYLQTDVDDFANLDLPCDVSLLPVYRSNNRLLWEKLSSEKTQPILFEGGNSGAGEVADWKVAAQVATTRNIVLAGGLNAKNVEQALDQVKPWGVDVSSGVESRPGVKDPRDIVRFIEIVRAHGGNYDYSAE